MIQCFDNEARAWFVCIFVSHVSFFDRSLWKQLIMWTLAKCFILSLLILYITKFSHNLSSRWHEKFRLMSSIAWACSIVIATFFKRDMIGMNRAVYKEDFFDFRQIILFIRPILVTVTVCVYFFQKCVSCCQVWELVIASNAHAFCMHHKMREKCSLLHMNDSFDCACI